MIECQTTLAGAWNFGHKYGMLGLQDAVMHQLVMNFETQDICPQAVHEAYKVDRPSELQRAFVSQLAIDMHVAEGQEWNTKTIESHGFGKATGFLLDLIEALPKVTANLDREAPFIKVDDFLLDHTS